MSDTTLVKRASISLARAVVALVLWALLFGYIVANTTIVGDGTDWGEVARISIIGLLPLVVALGLFLWHPNTRALWRGWTGVLMSWAVAIFASFFVVLSLGPFI